MSWTCLCASAPSFVVFPVHVSVGRADPELYIFDAFPHADVSANTNTQWSVTFDLNFRVRDSARGAEPWMETDTHGLTWSEAWTVATIDDAQRPQSFVWAAVRRHLHRQNRKIHLFTFSLISAQIHFEADLWSSPLPLWLSIWNLSQLFFFLSSYNPRDDTTVLSLVTVRVRVMINDGNNVDFCRLCIKNMQSTNV